MAAAAPLVSVCVPTYNDAPFLAQSLQSIVQQTYRQLEILIGDDASTDDTAAVVAAFDDPRIRYIRNAANLGQFENVNALIRRATGDYIAIYHSDDVYTPQIVAREAAFLQSHPQVGAVFALDWRIDERGAVVGQTRLLPEVRAGSALGPAELLPVLLRHKNRVFRAPTFMGRAELLRQVGGFSTQHDTSGDFEMWLRLLNAAPLAILGEYLMYYRRGPSQVSARYDRRRVAEDQFFVIMDRYLAAYWAKQGPAISIDAAALTEYAFHRCDDQTFRAANLILLGRYAEAAQLLAAPFPWRTFLQRTADLQRRKLAVCLLRALMAAALRLGAQVPLARMLPYTGYRGIAA